MSNATVNELRKKNDAAWERLERQLVGMEAHLQRAHAPGQWTTRQVLCHLLFEPGFRPTGLLECFAAADPPLIEIIPGVVTVTAERGRMTLAELTAALDAQRRQVFAYLETLGDIERYTVVFDHLRAAAYSPQRSASFIEQVASDMA